MGLADNANFQQLKKLVEMEEKAAEDRATLIRLFERNNQLLEWVGQRLPNPPQV